MLRDYTLHFRVSNTQSLMRQCAKSIVHCTFESPISVVRQRAVRLHIAHSNPQSLSPRDSILRDCTFAHASINLLGDFKRC